MLILPLVCCFGKWPLTIFEAIVLYSLHICFIIYFLGMFQWILQQWWCLIMFPLSCWVILFLIWSLRNLLIWSIFWTSKWNMPSMSIWVYLSKCCTFSTSELQLYGKGPFHEITRCNKFFLYHKSFITALISSLSISAFLFWFFPPPLHHRHS